MYVTGTSTERSLASLAITLALAVMPVPRTEAAIIDVPGDYPTIQQAVNAATSGDTIRVGPGTYTSSDPAVVDLQSKTLTFQSTAGAASTFIDGEHARRCIVIGETPANPAGSATFEGFTIRNGSTLGNGAGARVQTGNGTTTPSLGFTDCVIENCSAGGSGGGIYSDVGTAVSITGGSFQGNSVGISSSSNGGAAVFMAEGGSTTITGTLFANNLASYGCVYAAPSSSLTVDQCQFRNNVGQAGPYESQAGIYAQAAAITVTGCTFDANQGMSIDLRSDVAFASLLVVIRECTFENHTLPHSYSGGSIVWHPVQIGGSWTIGASVEDCLFRNNGSHAVGLGGSSMHLYSGSGPGATFTYAVTRCTFEDSEPTHGAVFCSVPALVASPRAVFDTCTFRNIQSTSYAPLRISGDAILRHCVFEDNSAGNHPGAIYSQLGHTTIEDCEFRRNSNEENGGALKFVGTFARTITVERCVFEENSTDGSAHSSVGKGGAIFTTQPITIRDCQFADNTALRYGGSVHLESHVGSVVERSAFRRNAAGQLGGAIFSPNAMTLSVQDSMFCENTPDDIYSSWTDLGGNDFNATCPTECLADISGDGTVNVFDLLALLSAWGDCPLPCPPSCLGDIATASGPGTDCTVNVFDLLAVLSGWGACP